MLLSFACLLCACGDVTPEKIERWKGTEKGPGKLREAVTASGVAPSLRAQALAALVEIGMARESIDAVKALPEAERAPLMREAAPRIAQMTHGNATSRTTRAQRQAKDALFELRPAAPDDVRKKLDEALLTYVTLDLAGRLDDGDHPTTEVLAALGNQAVPKLLELLSQPGANQALVASLLGRVADADGRARAAEPLVEAARKSSAHNREIPDDLLRAVASLGGPKGNAFLVDQAEHGPEPVREKVLLALAQNGQVKGDTTTLAAVLRIGADKALPGELREPAFAVAEKVGPEAVAPLVKIMASPDDATRWRACKAALVAGQAQAIAPVLEALPEKSYKPEDFDDYVVRDLKPIGEAGVPALKGELKSKSWVARAVAVRALKELGSAADADALSAVGGDGARLKGFPGNATVGSEAKAAIAALKSKK